MARKRTYKKATATKRPAAPNPTRRKRTYRRRTNPSGFAAKVKGLNLGTILTEGAAVAAGSLASSFASRQVARMLPNLNPALRTGLSTALVAGALGYFSGGKGFMRNMAVGATANGLTAVASSLMPGLFGSGTGEVGGIDGWNPDGTWNSELGAYEPNPDMGGIYVDSYEETPAIRSF